MDAGIKISWGTFSPDTAPSQRRLQTLGLTSAIRHYNDRSVPGLGGLQFGMPIAWSLLGVWLAEELGARYRPLSCANAIEAAVMVEALAKKRPRTRGVRKLAGISDRSFRALSRVGAYVTQPYRMGTVEPLLRLGLVVGSSQRFNLYRLAPAGERFLQSLGSEQNRLKVWASGSNLKPLPRLAPDETLPADSAKILERQLREHGEPDRRRALLDLPAQVLCAANISSQKPPNGIDHNHWNDIRSGVALIQLRNAALQVIGAVEKQLKSRGRSGLAVHEATQVASSNLDETRHLARIMLDRDDTSLGQLAHEFARTCSSSPEIAIAQLAQRDGTVIRLLPNGELGLGPAGGQSASEIDNDQDEGSPEQGEIVIPELPRINNLYALKSDLQLSMARN